MRRWLILGTALAGIGAGLGYAALAIYEAPGPLTQTTDIVVPRGRLGAVAGSLRASGVIRSRFWFQMAAGATAWQGRLLAAELSFPAHASLAAVLSVLRTGRPVQHLLTIPEGVTSARVGELLAQAPGLSGDVDLPPEGRVLPQTYAYVLGTSRQSLLKRAEAAMDSALAHAWATRTAGLPLRSPDDMLVLASVVERETHLPAERPIIAKAFFNRLRLGMRLQSDPTVIYGESGGFGELPAALTRGALVRASPYNTYVIIGLPAGPICNPGVASIEAVAHPALSDALYFVADGTGGHVFSDSLAEHDRNVERYRRISR